MNSVRSSKRTFEAERVIQPIYSGGSISLAEEGAVLATCVGEDVLLSKLPNGEQLARIEGDGNVVTALSITPSASHVIICSRSLSMMVYAVGAPAPGTTLARVELKRTLKAHSSPIVTTCTDRTGALLATGGTDGIVKVWDIVGGFVTHNLAGHGGIVTALHFFEVEVTAEERASQAKRQRRKRAAGGGAGGGGRGGGGGGGGGAGKEGEDNEVAVQFRLASGGEDGQIRVWNLHERKSACVLQSHVSVVRSLSFSAEQGLLLSGSRDKTVMLWDARTWKQRGTVPVLEAVESCGFLEGGTVFFAGGERGLVRLWRTSDCRESRQGGRAGGAGVGIQDIIYQRPSASLLVVHLDQTLIFYSVEGVEGDAAGAKEDLRVIKRVSGNYDEVIDVAFVGRDSSVMAVATNSEDVHLISADEGSGSMGGADDGQRYMIAELGLLKGHDDIVLCLSGDPSGCWLATGSKDRTARVWSMKADGDGAEMACVAVLRGHAESVGAVAISHEGAIVITGSQDRTIKRWRVRGLSSTHSSTDHSEDKETRAQAQAPAEAPAQAQALYTRTGHEKDINALDISDAGSLFASASQDRTVRIWTVEDGSSAGVLHGHKRGVWTVKFAPGGRQLASGSGDKTVKVWNVGDCSCLHTLEGHGASVLKAVWLSGGITNGGGGITNGSGGTTTGSGGTTTGSSGTTTSSAGTTTGSSSNSSTIASAGGDGLVKVWDVKAGEAVATLAQHSARVWALATTAARPGAVVSGGSDGLVTVWRETSAATAGQAAAELAQRVRDDEQLDRLERTHGYAEAMQLALRGARPARLLALFRTLLEGGGGGGGGGDAAESAAQLTRMQLALAGLADADAWTMLAHVREWSTNGRSAGVAQWVLQVLLQRHGCLAGAGPAPAPAMPAGRPVDVQALLDGIRRYSEREHGRLAALLNESYVLDYTLMEMQCS